MVLPKWSAWVFCTHNQKLVQVTSLQESKEVLEVLVDVPSIIARYGHDSSRATAEWTLK